jgi:hypothetical protein
MKCQDVRRTLSLFVNGQLALTEWAIIQGHLLECVECRKEVERLRTLAGVRARAKHHRATVAILAATAVVLAVAAGGGFYIYYLGSQWSFPDFPSWGTRSAPRTATPTTPDPQPANPVAPVPAPAPRPSPAPPAPEPAARATRPAAIAETPKEERMPTTQARPPAALTAPPGAEAMPTQGPSSLAPRSRP